MNFSARQLVWTDGSGSETGADDGSDMMITYLETVSPLSSEE
jgi:hypothetical protein